MRRTVTYHTNVTNQTPETSIVGYIIITRKPCYRKDDRALCPIYGRREKFLESVATPTAIFLKLLMGCAAIDRMKVHTQFVRSFTRY